MRSLNSDSVAAVMEVAVAAYSFEGLESFRRDLLPCVRRLIPGDVHGYNELDLETGQAVVFVESPQATFPELIEAFGATAHQHPGVQLCQRGDFRPHLLSDLMTDGEYHRLELYQEVYRHLGMEDQIYFNLTESANLVTVAISRSRRSFTDRDREMIEMLEPHLRRAYFQAHQRDLAKAVIAAQDAGLEEADTGVILLDDRGHIVHASGLSQQLLDAYCPVQHDVGGILPASLANWLDISNRDVLNSICITRPQGRLRVRALSGRTAEGWRTLLLDELPADHLPPVESLLTLGLTNRQAQVLRLLTSGSSTQTIADQLHLSPATIRKHLENIYSRLGTQSRTEAVAMALRHGLLKRPTRLTSDPQTDRG
jgi:DNA-binding NarL/FixJ family response regulator